MAVVTSESADFIFLSLENSVHKLPQKLSGLLEYVV